LEDVERNRLVIKNFTDCSKQIVTVLLFIAFSVPIHASRPCPPEMDCKISIEEVAQMLALFSSITEACSIAKPEIAARYKAGFAKMLEKEQAPNLIKSAFQHPQYKDFLKLAKQEVLKMNAGVLMHDCNALLK
jgi:hypothetical protein